MVDLSANLAQFKRHAFKPIKDGAYVIFCDVFRLRIWAIHAVYFTSALKVYLYERKGKC